MNLVYSLIILLIIAGMLTLIYVAGRTLEALENYIRHSAKRKGQANSPMANCKNGGLYGRINN